ncbi:hypothetical protein ISG29_09840, partial [Nocardioides sp. CBS4Y-1]|nr:hypothetical protein [Nocardioides acrostichi]
EQIDGSVKHAAAQIAATESDLPVDETRVQAVLRLLTSTPVQESAPAPKVDVWVHLPFDPRDLAENPETGQIVQQPRTTRTGGAATGVQPVTEDWVRDTLGPTARFTIRPVFYPREQAPVDAYEIPTRTRKAVELLTPADCFPYASATLAAGTALQLDHTQPYQAQGPPGQTAVENLGPLSVTHHRIKTHGRWHVVQPIPGIYLWTDPHNHHYLIDHTGTRPLPTTRRTRARPKPLVAEIYRPMPHLDLDLDYPHAS